MGKRRRHSGSVKKKSGKPPKAKENEEETLADIDEHCVTYESEAEDEKMSADGQAADNEKNDGYSDNSEEDSDEGDEADAIQLEDAADDESDVQVDLEFFDPTEEDTTPISAFLEEYSYNVVGRTKESGVSKSKPVSARGLSEAICKQSRVGTTVRVTNEKAPIGFISCLNVYEHREVLKPIKKQLLKESGGKAEFERMGELVKKTFENRGNYESQRMGLILSERVVNLPPQIIPKMLEALFCEIEWAVEDEPSVEEREGFRLGWYLYITEVYCKDSGKGMTKKAKRSEDDDIEFTRAEDEAWWRHATHKIRWTIGGEEGGKGGVTRKRMGMIICASKIKNVREMVSSMVGGASDDDDEEGEKLEKVR